MMAKIQKFRRNFLTCSICDGCFTNPKQLPCLHNFCEKCLREWTESECRKGKPFRCPMCRHCCGPDADDIDYITEWVSKLRVNNLVVGLSKVFTVETNGQNCDVCQAQGYLSSAVSWCGECEQILCHECRMTHSAFSSTRSHKSVSLSDDLAIKTTLKEKVEKCQKHPTESMKLVCSDCDNLICTVCSIVDHRNCKNIIGIAECVRSIERHNSTPVIESLEGQRQAVQAFENDISKRQDWLNTSIGKIKNKISQQRQEYIDAILQAEHDTLAQLDYVKKIQTQNITESLEEAIAIKNICDTTADLISETNNYGSDTDIWRLAHEVSFPVFLADARLNSALKQFNADATTISTTASPGMQFDNEKLFGRVKVKRMPLQNEGFLSVSRSSRSGSRSSSSNSSRHVSRIDLRSVYP